MFADPYLTWQEFQAFRMTYRRGFEQFVDSIINASIFFIMCAIWCHIFHSYHGFKDYNLWATVFNDDTFVSILSSYKHLLLVKDIKTIDLSIHQWRRKYLNKK